MFRHIVWSAQSYTLREFVDNYPLPQLVKVETGLYSDDDASTLSAEQILTLHITKRTDKVLMKATENRQYFLPLTCPYKVEILPKICEDTYSSVKDIVDASTAGDFKFIRVVHNGPPSMRIRAGDILKLKKTAEEHRVKFLECEFYNKTQDCVRLPLEFKAAFEPLACPKQYHLQEVLKSFTLPVRVKFSSCDTIIQDVNNDIDLQSLGSVLVKELREESTVIATSRDDEIVTVLMIPSDLDVKVNPALGALTGDENYARFCREIHDGTELTKVDNLNNSKLLDFSDEPTVDVAYDYVEVKPPLPPRSGLDSTQSEHSDSSEDYEDVDIGPPPPRPPKPPPKPYLKPHYENEQHDDVFLSNSPSSFEKESLPNDDDECDDDNADVNSEDEDYIYPETDLPEADIPSDRESEEKEKAYPSEEPRKSTLKKRVSDLFRKAIPRSSPSTASVHQATPYANVPTQRPIPRPLSPTATSSLSTSPLAKNQESTQLFPVDLSSLSVSEVGECLRKLNMGKHVEAFENHQIDGELFLTLDEQTLIDLEVSTEFQRNKLLRFINGWRPKMN